MTRRTLSPALLLATVAFAATAAAGRQSPAEPTRPAPMPPTTAPAARPAPDESKRVQAADIDALIADGKTVVLDVREPNELEETGTVKGAIHIPLGQLEARLGELPKDKVILTACRGGGRASRAMALLEAKGFKTAGFCGLADYKGARAFPAKKS